MSEEHTIEVEGQTFKVMTEVEGQFIRVKLPTEVEGQASRFNGEPAEVTGQGVRLVFTPDADSEHVIRVRAEPLPEVGGQGTRFNFEPIADVEGQWRIGRIGPVSEVEGQGIRGSFGPTAEGAGLAIRWEVEGQGVRGNFDSSKEDTKQVEGQGSKIRLEPSA